MYDPRYAEQGKEGAESLRLYVKWLNSRGSRLPTMNSGWEASGLRSSLMLQQNSCRNPWSMSCHCNIFFLPLTFLSMGDFFPGHSPWSPTLREALKDITHATETTDQQHSKQDQNTFHKVMLLRTFFTEEEPFSIPVPLTDRLPTLPENTASWCFCFRSPGTGQQCQIYQSVNRHWHIFLWVYTPLLNILQRQSSESKF